jgi:hypothetical protein
MGEIVNLRRARKTKRRAEDARTADQNRIAFGRTKDERTLSDKEKALAARRLDGHLLPDPESK